MVGVSTTWGTAFKGFSIGKIENHCFRTFCILMKFPFKMECFLLEEITTLHKLLAQMFRPQIQTFGMSKILKCLSKFKMAPLPVKYFNHHYRLEKDNKSSAALKLYRDSLLLLL